MEHYVFMATRTSCDGQETRRDVDDLGCLRQGVGDSMGVNVKAMWW